MDLFDSTIDQQEEAEKPVTHRDRFEAYHRSNPHVYSKLVALARQLAERGHTRYGIGGLFEVMRWHHSLKTSGDEPFKLGNNHRAFYARLIMENEPDLAGFFKIREQRSADSEAKDGNAINLN